VIKRDTKSLFEYLPLQSGRAAAILSKYSIDKQHVDSIVYVEGEKTYLRSTAILKILLRLGRGWQILYFFMIIPRYFRDAIYSFIARKRFRWFGKRENCYIPLQNDFSGNKLNEE
jgi:predicted DCC family thiol-disulfide oxidoreductase YuxK